MQTTETTSTSKRTDFTPAVPTEQTLEIRVSQRFRDEATGEPSRSEVAQSLVLPMPDTSPQLYTFGNRPSEDSGLNRSAMLVEDFFSGLGMPLPSRKKASEMIEQIAARRAEHARLQEAYLELKNSSDAARIALACNRDAWVVYARLLEQALERRGARIPATAKALRPTN